MKYDETISLKDGRTLRLRNGFEQDARAALEIFILGHEQTDYLLSYPDENDMTVDEEAQFLAKKAASADEIELLAYIGDRIVGLGRLKAIHLNDSMNVLGAHKDRHEKIGKGKIGLDALMRVVNHPKLKDLPFYLETPCDLQGYRDEIALIKKMSDSN